MLTLYLACLVVGGALVLVSLLGGDADADVDLDGAPEVDGTQTEGVASVARFLSLRSLVFFSAFFGLTGTLLSLVGSAVVPTAVAAVGLGLAAALAVERVMAWLRRSESGALRSLATLAGVSARVLVGLEGEKAGKVSVDTPEGTQQFVARVHERASSRRFEAGETVVIVRFQDGVALVAEPAFLG